MVDRDGGAAAGRELVVLAATEAVEEVEVASDDVDEASASRRSPGTTADVSVRLAARPPMSEAEPHDTSTPMARTADRPQPTRMVRLPEPDRLVGSIRRPGRSCRISLDVGSRARVLRPGDEANTSTRLHAPTSSARNSFLRLQPSEPAVPALKLAYGREQMLATEVGP